ncbi:hypothetical protein D9M72_568570 [compost metagenome]
MAMSSGFTLRATTDCKAITIDAQATTGSTARCGTAPWPPRPVTRSVTVSDEAMNGPPRKPNLPVGWPGMLCSANTASQGNRRNRPSRIISRAPPMPSSAGWKMTCSVPRKGLCSAR